MKHLLKLIAVLIIIGICSCGEKTKLSNSEKYVKQAFDSIKTYFIHRATYNFDSLQSVVLRNLSDSNNSTLIHQELESAIKTIDKHSYMLSKEEYNLLESGNNPKIKSNPFPFKGKMLNNKYAYLYLDGFLGVDSTSSKNYADSLQRLVKHLYDYKPLGWIIDLRFNSGGWVYPMIAGLGPILGKGIKAYEIDGNGIVEEYYFVKNESTYLKLSDSIYYFLELPVAILIGKETASAAELLALIFKGNPKTVLIGETTYGVATGLRGFFMPDSVQFAITTSIMTDRNKNGDGKPIHPTIFTDKPLEMFDYAYEWIEKNKD